MTKIKNPLSGRMIDIGGKVYNDLVAKGYFSQINTNFNDLDDASVYEICKQMDFATLKQFRLSHPRLAQICDKQILLSKKVFKLNKRLSVPILPEFLELTDDDTVVAQGPLVLKEQSRGFKVEIDKKDITLRDYGQALIYLLFGNFLFKVKDYQNIFH